MSIPSNGHSSRKRTIEFTNVLLRVGVETMPEYCFPPSAHPPIAIITFKSGFLSFNASADLKPPVSVDNGYVSCSRSFTLSLITTVNFVIRVKDFYSERVIVESEESKNNVGAAIWINIRGRRSFRLATINCPRLQIAHHFVTVFSR